MQIHVGYKKPKTYALTPTRKHIGKAVARGRRQSVAIECLKEPSTRKHLLKRIGMLVRNELIALCSDSSNSNSVCRSSLGRNSCQNWKIRLQFSSPFSVNAHTHEDLDQTETL